MSASLLADPENRPNADIVIWDGKCNYCRQQVQRLERFDKDSQLAYLSLHDPRTSQLVPNLSYNDLMDQLWVVTESGAQYGGADAGRYLSRKLRRLWWLAPILHIPGTMPFWRWLYKQVAKRRYRISGVQCDENGTCDLHR